MNQRYSPLHLRFLATLLLAMLVGCGDANNSATNMTPETYSVFNSKTWKAEQGKNGGSDNQRAPMVSELKEKVLQEGMKKSEVQDLLGPADFESGGADYYEIGRSPYGVDLEYFVVRYEDDSLVSFVLQRG